MSLATFLDGWQNFLEKSEVTEKLAKDRAKICAQCPQAKDGKLTAFIKDKLVRIQGKYCNKCKCPLSAKIRSKNEICPLKKW